MRLGGNGSGGSNSVSYTPAGTNSGGSVSNHTLTNSELPKLGGTFQMHGANAGTAVQHTTNVSGYTQVFSNLTTISGSYAIQYTTTGADSIGGVTLKIGGGSAHNHGFTNPTFKGTAASISITPKYVQVYAWKRTA